MNERQQTCTTQARRRPGRRVRLLLPLALFLAAPAFAQTCPALATYYPADEQQWPATLARLQPLLPSCLESAEYFALLGAAQLNTGNLAAALEALERALLLDPDNGAALVDYAQALYLSGQLFAALELNAGLLQRGDLPVALAGMLQQRQQDWQAQTSSSGLQLDLGAGYDNNLNGAPARSDFTLTLSGEQVVLTLDPEFRPASGPFLNLRLSGFYQKQTPERTHDLVYALRNRISEHHESDLLQFDWRYAQTLPLRRYRAELLAGTSHLLYGGSPLYTVTEARARLQRAGGGCQPLYELAAQHQYYHGQNFMAGVEASVAAGLECAAPQGNQRWGLELGPILNKAIKGNRPGDDRQGWRLRMSWQLRLGEGLLLSQFNYARLDDREGYSPLLADGARREIDSRFFRLQYSRPLGENLLLRFDFSHQDQDSNISPFENRGTAAELGFSYIF